MIKWGWQERQDLLQALRVANMDLESKLETLGLSAEEDFVRPNFEAQVSRNKALEEILDRGEEITIGEW